MFGFKKRESVQGEPDLRVRAYGKINLFLDITGRRADGYHLIDTVMQTIDLCDVLTFTKSDRTGVRLQITSTGTTGQAAETLPSDDRNLVVRAARLLLDRYGQNGKTIPGVEITLEKNIPMEAGLAGGSADAAAALFAVNRLFSLEIGDEAMAALALEIGADVPFCLHGGTQRARGIGEELSVLPDLPEAGILLVKPSENSSTRRVYQDFDALQSPRHPSRDAFDRSLSAGDLTGIAAGMGNVLEAVVETKIPRVATLREMLMEQGALGARMTGSGSTVFGIFADRERAQAALESMRERLGKSDAVFLTTPVTFAQLAQNRVF